MSGIKKRTMLLCHNKGGIQDSGWRRVITGIGGMLEPTPMSSRLTESADDYDVEYNDQIGHIDDLEFIPFGDWNRLSGTKGGPTGSADGWVHAGSSIAHGSL